MIRTIIITLVLSVAAPAYAQSDCPSDGTVTLDGTLVSRTATLTRMLRPGERPTTRDTLGQPAATAQRPYIALRLDRPACLMIDESAEGDGPKPTQVTEIRVEGPAPALRAALGRRVHVQGTLTLANNPSPYVLTSENYLTVTTITVRP